MTSTTLGHKNGLDKWGAVQILLIDEVLAVGDIEFQKKCIDKMMGFKNGVTMVFVSHPMSDVERICDRVMWIESHAINIVGEPKAVVGGYNKIIKNKGLTTFRLFAPSDFVCFSVSSSVAPWLRVLWQISGRSKASYDQRIALGTLIYYLRPLILGM